MMFASVGHWCVQLGTESRRLGTITSLKTDDHLFTSFRYAFSHKDYTELDIHSARMPIYYAVRDASGIKDIIQDSLETLKGTRFTYRTFEPSEGVATSGMSRDGRIQAGLRYTSGGQGKYWLPESNKIARDGLREITQENMHQNYSNTNNHNRPDLIRNQSSYGQSYSERAPSLYFQDVDEQDDDGMEELYDASKQLEFGDYNFPAIDVFDPHRSKESDRRKMARKNKKKARQYGESSSLLGAARRDEAESRPLMTESSGATFGKAGWGDYRPSGSSQYPTNEETEGVASREGCVDNVNGYVPDKKKKKGQTAPAHSANQNNNNNAYGYGYQSYQHPTVQQQLNQPMLEDDKDTRGPMFFFLG